MRWPFTPWGAVAYVAALAAWVLGLLTIIIRSGGTGHEYVHDLAGAVQLMAMIAAAGTISVLAFRFVRDETNARPATTTRLEFDIMWMLRSWALFFGLGLPAAIRTIRRSH